MKPQFLWLYTLMTKARTRIDILAGKASDSFWGRPKIVYAAALEQRVAVIQDSYRPDKEDAWFDLQLWERILEFAMNFGQGLESSIVERWKAHDTSLWESFKGLLGGSRVDESEEENEEVRPEIFLAALREKEVADQEPPEFILVRDNGALVLCIATEYWVSCGAPRNGPAIYADSYTYSIFSKSDIVEDVRTFLAEAKAAEGWEMHFEKPGCA
jgi:hypothetical protein